MVMLNLLALFLQLMNSKSEQASYCYNETKNYYSMKNDSNTDEGYEHVNKF